MRLVANSQTPQSLQRGDLCVVMVYGCVQFEFHGEFIFLYDRRTYSPAKLRDYLMPEHVAGLYAQILTYISPAPLNVIFENFLLLNIRALLL